MYHLTLPKSLVFVRGVSSPHLSFPMRAQLGAGRPWEGRRNPEGRMPTPAGSGCVQGKGGSAGAPHQEHACRSSSPRPGVRPALPNTQDPVFASLHFSLLV